MGRKLVYRIEDLHRYFSRTIKPSEEFLSLITCSILYASYLFLTTNFLEMANSLIKKAQKIMEEKKGELTNAIEYGLFLKVRENIGPKCKRTYCLVIDNVSATLAVAIRQEKHKLINNELSSLIPDEFSELHCRKFDEFYKISNFSNRKSNRLT
jgi:hypothetical protein